MSKIAKNYPNPKDMKNIQSQILSLLSYVPDNTRECWEPRDRDGLTLPLQDGQLGKGTGKSGLRHTVRTAGLFCGNMKARRSLVAENVKETSRRK